MLFLLYATEDNDQVSFGFILAFIGFLWVVRYVYKAIFNE